MKRLLLPLILSGCSTIEPSSLLVEAQHTSHISQHAAGEWSDHQPGYDTLGGAALWRAGPAYLKVGEYYSPECLDGRHEVFQASFGYEIKLK